MHQSSSRRRQLVARTLIYAFMTLSVLAIVTALMLVISGYSYSRQDGLVQGGLLQFATTPSGATVTLDETRLSSRTPNKSSVDARSHNVRMDLNGYRPWQKSITIQAGEVGWLSYARLIPSDIKTESLRTFPKLASSLVSKSGHWIAVQEDAASPAITLANIESASVKYTSLTIPAAALTATTVPVQAFTLEAWSENSAFLLVKRVYDGNKTEWLVVDRADPEKTINITTALAINPAKVVFGDTNGRNLYVQTDDIVRKIDLDAKTISRPLATNVAEFSVFNKTTLTYITKPDPLKDNQRHVAYVTDGLEAEQILWSYPAATPNLRVAFSDYYGKHYVAVTHGTQLELFTGTLPRGNTKANLQAVMLATLNDAPLNLEVSRTSRFVVVQLHGGFTTYDIELRKTDTTVFTQPATVQRPLQWLDDYTIWNDRANMMRFYEFDGANQQNIMPIVEGQAATLSADNKYVYGFSPAHDGVVLTRAKLIIE